MSDRQDVETILLLPTKEEIPSIYTYLDSDISILYKITKSGIYEIRTMTCFWNPTMDNNRGGEEIICNKFDIHVSDVTYHSDGTGD